MPIYLSRNHLCYKCEGAIRNESQAWTWYTPSGAAHPVCPDCIEGWWEQFAVLHLMATLFGSYAEPCCDRVECVFDLV